MRSGAWKILPGALTLGRGALRRAFRCPRLLIENGLSVLSDSVVTARDKLQPTLLSKVVKEIENFIEENVEENFDDEDFELTSKRRPGKKVSKKKRDRFEKAFLNFMEEVDDDNALECAPKEMLSMYEDMVEELDD